MKTKLTWGINSRVVISETLFSSQLFKMLTCIFQYSFTLTR